MPQFNLLFLLMFGALKAISMNYTESVEGYEEPQSIESCVLELRWTIIDYLHAFTRSPHLLPELGKSCEQRLETCKARADLFDPQERHNKKLWIDTLRRSEEELRRIKSKPKQQLN